MMNNLRMCIKGGSTGRRTGWLIRFDYDPEIVKKLKNSIPHTHREWHAEPQTWWVSNEYEEELDRLFGNWHILAKQQLSMLDKM